MIIVFPGVIMHPKCNCFGFSCNNQDAAFIKSIEDKQPIVNEYQLHGHILDTETNSKYLEVTINNKLCWTNHVNNICKKANNSLAFLRRNLQISQTHIKANAYTSLVRPQLEYAAVWDPFIPDV